MTVLFLDTETTGQLWKNVKETAPYQPDIVQLAFMVDDDRGETVATHSFLVQPRKGSRVQKGAQGVHGITTKDANTYGLPPSQALKLLGRYLTQCNRLVAHNMGFDWTVLRIAQNRTGLRLPDPEKFCTMEAATEECKLPPVKSSSTKYKFAKLDEAYRILVDPAGFSGAHDALSDVRACRSVYYALSQ